MAKIKRIIEITFLTAAAVVLLAQITTVYLGWRHGKSVDKEILQGSRAAVVKTVPQFPPAFLVEYENSGRLPIPKTRFRLTIELHGTEIARTERDYGEIKPGKAERLLLQTVPSVSPPPAIESGARLTYRLLVYPNNKKPLPEILGELEVL